LLFANSTPYPTDAKDEEALSFQGLHNIPDAAASRKLTMKARALVDRALVDRALVDLEAQRRGRSASVASAIRLESERYSVSSLNRNTVPFPNVSASAV
jgi:hypothetical protein